ncbi:DNA methyltransferase [Candidatus Pelagibacter sp.]|nr:DNA methyltransferase [Candidatus Pelagibacter sp.]
MKKFKNLIEAANDKSKVRGYTHRFYTYPGGFSPIFVKSAIKTFTKKKDLVLDPFMGGGTSLIEAIRLNRKVVGIDLNPIAYFVTKVKITKLSKAQIDKIELWAFLMSQNLNYKLKNDQFTKEALSIINYKGLGRKDIFNLKTIIKGTSFYLKKLKEIKDKKVKDFLKLLILRCLHSTLHDKRPIADFHIFKRKIRSNSLDMLEGMSTLDKYLINSRNKFSIYSKSSTKINKTKELKSKKVKLIITSPPYPGINISYSRWQIHGRRNTTLPYLVLGIPVPENKSIFNFQSPRNKTYNLYFDKLKTIFKSIKKICSKNTIILQLVAFNHENGLFEKYLKTLEDCGFKEMKLKKKGRVWREVPNRSWQAKFVKGNIPASNEVLLLHKIK